MEIRQKKTGRDENNKYFVQAVGKAFDILNLVNQYRDPVPLVQLTRELRQSKSSVFRILWTLEELGLVTRLPGDLYSASARYRTAVPNQLLDRLLKVAEAPMRELGWEYPETVSLAFLFENHIGAVAVVDSPHKIRMDNVVGGIIPPHASSLGKCITAAQEDTLRNHLLRAYGNFKLSPYTITDEAALHEEFRLVREQGYAIDREESTLDGCCFGAPISTAGGQVIGGVSLSMPKYRLLDEEKVIRAICETAKAITNKLNPSNGEPPIG